MELVSMQAFWVDKLLAAAFLIGLIYLGYRLKKDFRLWFCVGGFLAFLVLFSVMRFVLFLCFYQTIFRVFTVQQIIFQFQNAVNQRNIVFLL